MEVKIFELRENCFYCVAEAVGKKQKREPDEVPSAMTRYKGTPVCGLHAWQILKGRIEKADNAAYGMSL